MAIDTSGKWWVGEQADDIGEYLKAYSEDGYKTTTHRIAMCSCGWNEFELEADDDEGVARRTCTKCKHVHYICDSEQYWSDADPTTYRCVECNSTRANVGVGFSMHEDDPTGIRWLYVGERCANCGVLGCMAGWKVGLSDALHLLDQV